MGLNFSFVTGLGFLAAVIFLVASLRAGRQRPHHQVLWIIGVVALIASVIFRFVLFIGASAQGSPLDALPILIGNLAVILVVVSAFFQPLWSGWLLIGSAIAMPLLSLLFELLASDGSSIDSVSVAPAVLIAYSLPALITGALFLISMRKSVASNQPLTTTT